MAAPCASLKDTHPATVAAIVIWNENIYAGKKRARKMKRLHEIQKTEQHWKAIESHLRHIGAAGAE